MALSSGNRLGPYQIDGPLGAGGMGEVYRATDTNLSRQVAIKVLPEAVAGDADRLARFDREARTLAALNHPNIAAIYGLERSGGITALVMELVEGPTLAERIEQGALPLDEALPIALQIAKALESAHEQGIIHRDLKPANIKVRADGTVKVLDFGLAKALGPDAPASANAASLSPTITSPAMMTGAGIILGTAAYMSPEQARGKAVDKRADIWAFGVVLFEMLSGQRAFAGEDVSDILADVMRVEPAWAKLPETVPPALLTFLKQCLRKNPSERIRDIGDVRLALEGAFDTIVHQAPVSESSPVLPHRPLWRRLLPVGATLLVAGGAAAAGWFMKPAVTQPVVRAVHVLPAGRTFRGIGRPALAISPDGRQIVYNGTGGLYLRSLNGLGDQLIPGTEGDLIGPLFSPDGMSLAFYQDGYIRRIPLAGGASTPIVKVAMLYGFSWEADAAILYATDDGVWQISENGGEPTRVLKNGETDGYGLPQRLPGGEWLLATAFRLDAQSAQGSAVAISTATGERRTLQPGVVGGRYLASGHLLYLDGGVLYAVPFDAKHAVVKGGPVAVVEGVRSVAGVFGVPQAAVSPSGTLAFLPGAVATSRSRFSLATADRAGAVMSIPVAAAPYAHVRATRDGTKVVVDTDDGKEAFVSIYEMAGTSAMSRLTFEGKNRYPVWSPDGRRVAFQSDRGGDPGIYVQNANGTGMVERLTQPEKGTSHIPESWSRDGRSLSFSVLKEKAFSLHIYSFNTRASTPFGNVRSLEPISSVFSPNGNWIAYHVLEDVTSSGRVFVEPFPRNGDRFLAPRVNRDFQPVWSHDGTELLYIPSTASGQMVAVRFTTTPAVVFGSPTTFPFPLTAGRLSGNRRAFDVLPDGRFVSLSGESTAAAPATEIRFVVNWFEELRRLAAPRP